MKYTSKPLEDGSLEVTVVVTRADLEAAEEAAKRADALTPHGDFLGISFARKTDYCLDCNNPKEPGRRQTIWAYGDIHAFAIAVGTCGPHFQITKGSCK